MRLIRRQSELARRIAFIYAEDQLVRQTADTRKQRLQILNRRIESYTFSFELEPITQKIQLHMISVAMRARPPLRAFFLQKNAKSEILLNEIWFLAVSSTKAMWCLGFTEIR